MLSPKAVAYALVDLYEHDTVQLHVAADALQVMERAGAPCVLSHAGDVWTVRLETRASPGHDRIEVQAGAANLLEGAA